MKHIILFYFLSIILVISIISSLNFVYAQDPSQSNKLTEKEKSFNIAIASDWGCNEDAKKTSQNIQNKNPELVIAAGDLSYKGSADCWANEISPFKSKLKIAMGDHDYDDTLGGKIGVINEYLDPLNLGKTYYSFNLYNAHLVFMDPYLDYGPGSDQYQFIANDLKNAFKNPKIDWTFVVEHIPIYTSPSEHPSDSFIGDLFHPLFDKYGVDLVFSGDNHNYQRTFPLKYNNNGGYSSPLISNKNTNKYNNGDGVIYIISGTAGRSLYEIKEQSYFVSKQDDKNFGFLNIDIKGKSLKGIFYPNSDSNYKRIGADNNNNIVDQFSISKENNGSDKEFNNL